MNNTSTTLTAYKLHKQFANSLDLFDLLEAYYPEKHNTIVRMRNIAYRELIETGAIKEDGTIDEEVDIPYRKLLNTHIPTNWFSCSPNTIIETVDKLRSQIDLLPPVYLIDEGAKPDLFETGERLAFPWFPYTRTASHLEIVGGFIQKLIDDIENGVDIVGKVKS